MKQRDRKTFACVVENTPLISIDLVIKDHNGEILLDRHTNEPAKDHCFVPEGHSNVKLYFEEKK
ncbi:MAG: hypothetical protein WBG65_05395 [Sulfurimonadaceae bacterium]